MRVVETNTYPLPISMLLSNPRKQVLVSNWASNPNPNLVGNPNCKNRKSQKSSEFMNSKSYKIYILTLLAIPHTISMAGAQQDLGEAVNSWRDERLTWTNAEGLDKFEEYKGESLRLKPKANTDIWSRTFYQPPFEAFTAPCLTLPLERSGHATVEAAFTLDPQNQFDQAGVVAFVDHNHSLKAGLEYVDGQPRLSVVVTNRGYSDWSTMPFNELSLRLRLHKRDASFVVQVIPEDSEKKAEFIRIAHLDGPKERAKVNMGVYACNPEKSGGTAIFDDVTVVSGSKFDHTYSGER